MNKKIVNRLTAMAVASVVLIGGNIARASEVTSGSWSLYYNSPSSYSTTDSVLLTSHVGTTFTAKCSTLSNSNLAVDFTDNDITPQGDGSLIFTKTGTKRFTFTKNNNKNVYVSFKLSRSGSATGTATGSAKKGTY